MEQAILHLDLDSFYVSVERKMNAALKGRPVIVGGKSSRGVVAACSYEARKFGLYSAMPMSMARRLCPEGIYLSGDYEAYSRESALVTSIIAEEAPLYEKASIDEFYLDISGMDRFFGTQKWAWALREKIKNETALPLSVGLSINKTVSKIATGEAKPDNKKYVPAAEVQHFLDPLDIKKMPMVGESTYQLLRKLGVSTIGKLRRMPPELLQRVLGKNGHYLWKKANGIDPTPIAPYSESKSISTETTFDQDTADMKLLTTQLKGMTERLLFELRKDDRMTGCISIKLRYSDFQTVSKQMKIPYTSLDALLIPRILQLFETAYDRRLLIRLVGIRFSDLIQSNYQLKLFESNQDVLLVHAMDAMRRRYGLKAVVRASGMLWEEKTD